MSETGIAEALEVSAPVETPALTTVVDPPKEEKASEETLQELFGDDPEKADVDDEPAPVETREPVSKKEQPKSGEEPSKPDAEYDAAFQLLLDAGHPPNVLRNVPKKDLVSWSQREAKRAADIRSTMQERSDLREKLAKIETTDKAEQPSSGVPSSAPDLKEAVAHLAEAFGPELGKSLEGFGGKLLEMAAAAVEARYAEQLGGLSTRAQVAQELLIESTRARLVESFPKLADDAEFDKVIEKTKALAATGSYNDKTTIRGQAYAAMSDACGLLFGAPANEDGQRKKEVNRSKDNSQPASRAPRIPGAPQSFEKKAWDAFNAAEDGDENKARMIMGRK